MKNIIWKKLSVGLPKKREESDLCGGQLFFVPIVIGMIFFVSFFDQAKKERINDVTLAAYEHINLA